MSPDLATAIALSDLNLGAVDVVHERANRFEILAANLLLQRVVRFLELLVSFCTIIELTMQ